MKVYKDYKKKVRKSKQMIESRIYGCDESNTVANADHSSGDDDEDKRAAPRDSRPKSVLHLDREFIEKKGMTEDVVYVFYTNHEIMRHSLKQFRNKHIEVLQRYLNTLEGNKFTDENQQQLVDNRYKIKLEPTSSFNAMEMLDQQLCPVPTCPFSSMQLDSRDKLIHHVKVHCLLEHTYSKNDKYWSNSTDNKLSKEIEAAIGANDADKLDQLVDRAPFAMVGKV